MSFSYDGLPGTTSANARRDAVRLMLRDTVETRALFQDDEVAFLLAQAGNNIYRAAARGCDIMSAREAEAQSVGDLSISGMGINWRELGKRYRRDATSQAVPFAGGISLASKETYASDPDRTPPAFSRTLMSNGASS